MAASSAACEAQQSPAARGGGGCDIQRLAYDYKRASTSHAMREAPAYNPNNLNPGGKVRGLQSLRPGQLAQEAPGEMHDMHLTTKPSRRLTGSFSVGALAHSQLQAMPRPATRADPRARRLDHRLDSYRLDPRRSAGENGYLRRPLTSSHAHANARLRTFSEVLPKFSSLHTGSFVKDRPAFTPSFPPAQGAAPEAAVAVAAIRYDN